jgi:hypothetical protein
LFAAPDTGVTDVYFAEGQFGGWAVYRGSRNRQQWLYRCREESETWIITSESDQGAWSRCEGRLWIKLETARLRSDRSDDSTVVHGLQFDFSPYFRECATGGATQHTTAGSLTAPSVACALLMRFGAHAVGTGGASVTVRLPSTPDGLTLLGDVVVRAGDTLVLEAEPQSESALLCVGRRQLRVERGGRLDLVRVHVVDSIDSSAVFSEGQLHLLNCTFERCVANTNIISRVAEGLVAAVESGAAAAATVGTALASAIVGAWGGAVLAFWTAASVISRGSTFVNNAARGGRVVNAGGAICAFGASVVLEANTTFETNYAEGGSFIARGGAISAVYGRLEVAGGVFSRNWVRPDQRSPDEAAGRAGTADGAHAPQ